MHGQEKSGPLKHPGLVLPQPGGLQGVEAAAQRPSTAVIQIVGAQGGVKGLLLLAAAGVVPHDGGAQGLAPFIHGHHGAPLGGQGQGHHLFGGARGGRQHLFHGVHQRVPPGLSLLLAAAHRGASQRIALIGMGNNLPILADQHALGACGAYVNANQMA